MTRSLRLISGLSCSALLATATAQNAGCAFDLNVDGYIEVPYSPAVVPQAGITFEAWFTYDDALVPLSWRYPTFARQGIGAGGENWFLRMDCDNTAQRELRWKIVTASGATVQTSYFFQPGEFLSWTHVAATYDGANSVIYINGQPVATAVGNGSPIRDLGSDVLRIGKGSDIATPIEVFNGELDEVRLWPYGRTQADIMATMNMELSAVPGGVSAWNLNGDFLDSSGSLNATSGGQVTFTANPLLLTVPIIAPGLPAGASTPGCLGDIALSTSGPATPGYTGFGVVATRTPANAFTLWGASAGILPSPLPLLGIDIWIDPTGVITLSGLANGLGASRLDVPVPAGAPLGFAFTLQAVVLDPCGSQGFTASDALTIIVQ